MSADLSKRQALNPDASDAQALHDRTSRAAEMWNDFEKGVRVIFGFGNPVATTVWNIFSANQGDAGFS